MDGLDAGLTEGEEPESVRSEGPDVAAAHVSGDDPLVQFVVVRRDLLATMGWPTGSVITQACHAVAAVNWKHRYDPAVVLYCDDTDNMRKVVKEVKGEVQLRNLCDALEAQNLDHHLWVEQPENIPTAVALKPFPKSVITPVLKKYSLFR